MKDKRRHLLYLRNGLPLLVWAVALSLALNSGWLMAYRLLYVFTLLIMVSLFWSAGAVIALTVRRDPVSRSLQVGDILAEKVQVRNCTPFPQLWVAIEDQSDLPLHRLSQVITYIGPRSQQHYILRTLCLRRGRYRLGPTVLRGSDPFGIFRTQRYIGHSASVVIYPRIFDLDPLGLPSGVVEAGSRRSRRTADSATDVFAVREYQPGDSLNRIHWLSTARHGHLMSKEFEYNPGGDVWVVLDLQRAVQAGALLDLQTMKGARFDREHWPMIEPATEEYGVTVAASLAAHFLGKERAVGFLTYAGSRTLLLPDRGERHLNRILDYLAVINAQGIVPLHQVLDRELHNFRRSDTVVLITPSNDMAWVNTAHSLKLRGIHTLTVTIDAGTFRNGVSGSVQAALAARRLSFCALANGQRPDQMICVDY